jgi:hypothetical protein
MTKQITEFEQAEAILGAGEREPGRARTFGDTYLTPKRLARICGNRLRATLLDEEGLSRFLLGTLLSPSVILLLDVITSHAMPVAGPLSLRVALGNSRQQWQRPSARARQS